MKIGKEIISNERPTHLIAEIGINHDGSVKKAIELIKKAKESGANSVKLQNFSPDSFLSKKSQYLSIFEKVNLTFSEIKTLFEFSRDRNIEIFSSVFDFKKIEELEKLNCPAYKVASGDINHIPMLKCLASLNKPMIISTGGSNLFECEQAINSVKEVNENIPIALLHCVSNYPAQINQLNLQAISYLKSKFKIPIGFSDHTIGTSIPIIASAVGANIIEKHFTLSKKDEGPDHSLSADPQELKVISEGINEVFDSLGNFKKEPVESKKQIIAIRRSIVANCKILKGDLISHDKIAYKRPGDGVSPIDVDKIVNKFSLKNFEIDEQIDTNFLSEKKS